jgi:hypothetical protein
MLQHTCLQLMTSVCCGIDASIVLVTPDRPPQRRPSTVCCSVFTMSALPKESCYLNCTAFLKNPCSFHSDQTYHHCIMDATFPIFDSGLFSSYMFASLTYHGHTATSTSLPGFYNIHAKAHHTKGVTCSFKNLDIIRLSIFSLGSTLTAPPMRTILLHSLGTSFL